MLNIICVLMFLNSVSFCIVLFSFPPYHNLPYMFNHEAMLEWLMGGGKTEDEDEDDIRCNYDDDDDDDETNLHDDEECLGLCDDYCTDEDEFVYSSDEEEYSRLNYNCGYTYSDEENTLQVSEDPQHYNNGIDDEYVAGCSKNLRHVGFKDHHDRSDHGAPVWQVQDSDSDLDDMLSTSVVPLDYHSDEFKEIMSSV